MRLSDTRILMTHTGSLPRPPSLVELYVRKARGEHSHSEAGSNEQSSSVDRVRDGAAEHGAEQRWDQLREANESNVEIGAAEVVHLVGERDHA